MLSISMVGKALSPMTTSEHASDAYKDAVAFIGQLRNNEEKLIERAKLFLKKDRDYCKRVFSTQVEGWTPFHAFVMRSAKKLVKLALKAGVCAYLEMGAPEGLPSRCTPLHLAAHRGDISIIQILLQNGAIVNKRDGSNHTPVYYAMNAKHTLAVKKLIKYGSDTSEMTPAQRRMYYELTEPRAPALLCLPTRSASIRGNRNT